MVFLAGSAVVRSAGWSVFFFQHLLSGSESRGRFPRVADHLPSRGRSVPPVFDRAIWLREVRFTQGTPSAIGKMTAGGGLKVPKALDLTLAETSKPTFEIDLHL